MVLVMVFVALVLVVKAHVLCPQLLRNPRLQPLLKALLQPLEQLQPLLKALLQPLEQLQPLLKALLQPPVLVAIALLINVIMVYVRPMLINLVQEYHNVNQMLNVLNTIKHVWDKPVPM
jgi:hypothetical protein